jgi:hypothetical protein
MFNSLIIAFLVIGLFGSSLTIEPQVSNGRVAKRFLASLAVPGFYEDMMDYQIEQQEEREFQEWLHKSFEQLLAISHERQLKLNKCESELERFKMTIKSNQTQS